VATATPLGAEGSSVAFETVGLLRACSEVGSESAESCGVATASPHGAGGEAAQAGLLAGRPFGAAAGFWQITCLTWGCCTGMLLGIGRTVPVTNVVLSMVVYCCRVVYGCVCYVVII
jgi:hypothetical protein